MAWEGLERVGLRAKAACRTRRRTQERAGLLRAVGANPAAGHRQYAGPQEQRWSRGACRQAHRIGLVGAGPGDGRVAGDGGGGEVSRALIEDVLMQSTQAAVGRRTTEDIASRLLREARGADDLAVFDDAVNLLASLCRLEGHPQEVLDRARGIGTARGVERTPSISWTPSLAARRQRPAGGQLTLDLGPRQGHGVLHWGDLRAGARRYRSRRLPGRRRQVRRPRKGAGLQRGDTRPGIRLRRGERCGGTERRPPGGGPIDAVQARPAAGRPQQRPPARDHPVLPPLLWTQRLQDQLAPLHRTDTHPGGYAGDLLRNSDVPPMVEEGSADMGIVDGTASWR